MIHATTILTRSVADLGEPAEGFAFELVFSHGGGLAF